MKIFVANWKMNHAFDETDEWLEIFFRNFVNHSRRMKDKEIVVCPPAFLLDYIDTELMEDGFKYLEIMIRDEGKAIEQFSAQQLNEILLRDRPMRLGGQDCHFEESGSFTGDISADMLSKVGCEYVILGHSERRTYHKESSEIVAKKVSAALKKMLIPIICVGETREIRDAKKHREFVYEQIMKSIPQDINFERLVIAYEPVWSIGTGVVPTTEEISEMMNFIKQIFDEKLENRAKHYVALYGGSVNSENSKEILEIPNVDGLLVGKASLDAIEFLKICGINLKI
jgi:triosephosphate isomerase (TIM)